MSRACGRASTRGRSLSCRGAARCLRRRTRRRRTAADDGLGPRTRTSGLRKDRLGTGEGAARGAVLQAEGLVQTPLSSLSTLSPWGNSSSYNASGTFLPDSHLASPACSLSLSNSRFMYSTTKSVSPLRWLLHTSTSDKTQRREERGFPPLPASPSRLV